VAPVCGDKSDEVFGVGEGGARLIVFYKVDNAFPNGLSTPIYGGITSEGNKGCFINHDVLGPLYLDIPPSGDPVIYKLNQIPELLKSAAK
jgi:hypothetical protein